jgi:hypothetical protein
MPLDLRLPDIQFPRLPESFLKQPLNLLRQIQDRNEVKWGDGGGSKIFNNRKERLRRRIQGAVNPRSELSKIQSTEVGWQRLLLSLYVESHGQDWLPIFDLEVATLILGADACTWSSSRRRQATLLFFSRFDTLPSISLVADHLRKAYDLNAGGGVGVGAILRKEGSSIFHSDGPQRIAKMAKQNESLEQLRDRFGVPEKGRFSEKLRQVYLLEALQRCALGDQPEVLQEIERCRSEPALDSLCLGAAALRILVLRVENEAPHQWPEGWRGWLIRLGCDPRMGRHSAEGAKWWGWATDSQWHLAVQGIIGLSLKFFFEFLDGTVSAHQWEERREFLEALFDEGKILDARLVLNARCIQKLPPKMRDKWNTASLTSTTEDTCVIALRCSNEVSILEGTHSYGLRAFLCSFPVEGFWERTRQQYADSELRISPQQCPIFEPHIGDWIRKFKRKLANQFHVEWENFSQNTAYISNKLASSPTPTLRSPSVIVTNKISLSLTPRVDSDLERIVESYLGHLSNYLKSEGKLQHLRHRQTLLRELIVKQKIEFARMVTDSEKRQFLLLRCIDNILLVDAIHYENLRGTHRGSDLWNDVFDAPGRAPAILRKFDFELRLNHVLDVGYGARFRESLKAVFGVSWIDLEV